MFLVNKLAKMNHKTPLGSRIAEVHNGSSLFTGDAGQGESNIRRWIIENDWLEAIIALPLNMFYNPGIATYIWVISNRKPEHRKGKVQLIDGSSFFQPLRKNLGKKNCELSATDISTISKLFLDFKEAEQSKIFENKAFGYWKVTVERPLRLHSQFTRKAIEALRFASGDEEIRRELFAEFGQDLYERFGKIKKQVEEQLKGSNNESEDDSDDDTESKPTIPEKRRKKLLNQDTWKRDRKLLESARKLSESIGEDLFTDHNAFLATVDDHVKRLKLKLSAAEKKLIIRNVSWRVEDAPPVIKKVFKPGRVEKDPLRGRYEQKVDGKTAVVEYEPDTELRDTEQVPLLEVGGIEEFIKREVLPYTPDAWINESSIKIGYEISFTRYYYKPQPLRNLEEIRSDIIALEKDTEGLLEEIIGGTKK
jgi:type I restriction enzyme M protein